MIDHYGFVCSKHATIGTGLVEVLIPTSDKWLEGWVIDTRALSGLILNTDTHDFVACPICGGDMLMGYKIIEKGISRKPREVV